MRSSRRSAPPLWITLALLIAVPTSAPAQERAPAAAPVLRQVPADALAVLRFRNARQVSDKFREFAKRIGIDDLSPELADPLRFVLGEMKVTQGFDAGGDVVLALFPPQEGGGPPRAVAFVPVSDYAAFVGNFQGAQKDGQADVVDVPQMGRTFMARRGRHAALTGQKELLQKLGNPRGGFRIAPSLAPAWEGRDIGFYVNMPAVRDAYRKEIDEAKKLVDEARVGNAKQDLFARILGGHLHGGLTQFMDDAEGLLIGFTIDREGVSHTLAAHFKPGTPTAKLLAPAKNTEASLLAGIPDDPAFKHLVVGGWAHEAGGVWKLVEATYSTVAQGLGMSEVEAMPIRQYLDLIKNLFTAGGGGSFTVPRPDYRRTKSFFRGVAVLNGDSRKLLAGYRGAIERKGNGAGAGADAKPAFKWKTTYDEGHKTLAGVTLDRYTMGLAGGDESSEAEQLKYLIQFFYGAEMEGLLGRLDDRRLLSAVNMSDDEVKRVAALKPGDSPLDRRPAIQAVSARLPRGRVAVFYIFLGEWADTAVEIAGQFGLTTPPNLVPANLPPIGVTVGFEDKAGEGVTGRLDSHVPSDLVAGLVQAGKKLKAQFDPPALGEP